MAEFAVVDFCLENKNQSSGMFVPEDFFLDAAVCLLSDTKGSLHQRRNAGASLPLIFASMEPGIHV